MKKLAVFILVLAMLLSVGATASAADGPAVLTAVKTGVQASSVVNYGGYGAVAMETDATDYLDLPLKKSGLIDKNGSFLFPYAENVSSNVTYQYVYSEGFVTIERDSKYAQYSADAQYYSLDGSVAIDLPDITGELLAQLMEEDTDLDYDPVVEVEYWVSPFHDGIAIVREDYWQSVKRVTPGTGMASGVSAFPLLHRAYLMDTKGNIVCELPELYADTWVTDEEYFWATFGTASEGLIPIVVKGYDEDYNWYLNEFGYMDYSGNIKLNLLGSAYSNRGYFSEGLAWVVDSSAEACGYIDKSGNVVIPAQYDSVYPFESGFAAVKKDGKWGAVDKNGKTVIPFEYDSSFGTKNGYMTVGLNGKYGLVDKNNNVVLPIEYDDISVFDEGVAYAVKNGYVYVITETKQTASNRFSDVAGTAYYAAPVAWAVENGITDGTTDTTFSPDMTCSNAHIITFLWRAYGSPEVEAVYSLTDAAEGDYYYKPAQWAKSLGMLSGSALLPNEPCTRASTVTFMWKAAGSPSVTAKTNFKDVPPDAEYAMAVAWALENGVTDGTSDTTFSPDATCTRAQIVTFLYRALAG